MSDVAGPPELAANTKFDAIGGEPELEDELLELEEDALEDEELELLEEEDDELGSPQPATNSRNEKAMPKPATRLLNAFMRYPLCFYIY